MPGKYYTLLTGNRSQTGNVELTLYRSVYPIANNYGYFERKS